MSNNTTNENIKNGNGLEPIKPSTSEKGTINKSGITVEQRSTDSGIKIVKFSEQKSKNGK